MSRPSCLHFFRGAFIVLNCWVAFFSFAASPLPEAGGLSALPHESRAPVTLRNHGFEQNLAGWSPAQPEALAVSTNSVHSGTFALRFDGAAETRYVPSVRQTVKDTGPGAYLLRFHLKTTDLGLRGKPTDGVRVAMEFERQDGSRAWPATEVFRGTTDWQQKELRAYIPPEFKRGTMMLNVQRYGGAGGGEAFFDDFSLEHVVPPPVEAFLLYPNYRGFIPPDGKKVIRLWVNVNAPNATEAPGIEVTQVDGGKSITGRTRAKSAGSQVIDIDSRAWQPGAYRIQVRLAGYAYPPCIVRKLTEEEWRAIPVWFDERGVLHHKGKATFPLGFYNAQGWDSVERLDQLGQARPNMAIDYASWALPLDRQRAYLGQMQERGIMFLSTVNMVYPHGSYNVLAHPIGKELLPGISEDTQENLDAYLERLGAALCSMPGHAGWYTMDERPFHDVPRHFRQYDLLRRIDPGHPCFGVSDKPDEIAFWRDAVDVIGLDPYPLFNSKLDRPLSMVGDWTRAAAAATHGSRPIWMVLQFFQGWSADRWPTEEDLRAMSIMAVTEGARGLFYWSFGVRGLKAVRDPKEQADYWRRATAVSRQLKSLEPALLAPDDDFVQAVSEPAIRWRARTAEGKRFIFAYRPARRHSDRRQAPIRVTFTMANGSKVVESFAPDEAHIIEFPAR